jgi:ribosomal protein S18 acetylase RimI-like enzyme
MRFLIQSSNTATWIAEENGRMTGLAIVEWAPGGRSSSLASEREVTAYIQTIEVAPEARGQGAGGELLGRIEASARAAGARLIWLHVEAENSRAIRLYEAQGYTRKGRRENYYPQGKAALIYVKVLDSA